MNEKDTSGRFLLLIEKEYFNLSTLKSQQTPQHLREVETVKMFLSEQCEIFRNSLYCCCVSVCVRMNLLNPAVCP